MNRLITNLASFHFHPLISSASDKTTTLPRHFAARTIAASGGKDAIKVRWYHNRRAARTELKIDMFSNSHNQKPSIFSFSLKLWSKSLNESFDTPKTLRKKRSWKSFSFGCRFSPRRSREMRMSLEYITQRNMEIGTVLKEESEHKEVLNVVGIGTWKVFRTDSEGKRQINGFSLNSRAEVEPKQEAPPIKLNMFAKQICYPREHFIDV